MAGNAEKDNLTAEQQELCDSEIRYRCLFEAARDGILILDAETLKITDVNPYMIELLGYSREEFIGSEVWEIGIFSDKKENQVLFEELRENGYIRCEDAAKTNETPLEILSGGETRNFENCCRHKNGALVDVMWTAFWSVKDSLLFCVAHDITERKAAENEMRLMKSAFDSIVEGIVISDAQNPTTRLFIRMPHLKI